MLSTPDRPVTNTEEAMKMFTKVFTIELQSSHDIVQYCFIFIVLCYCFEMHFVALCCVVLCCDVSYSIALIFELYPMLHYIELHYRTIQNTFEV